MCSIYFNYVGIVCELDEVLHRQTSWIWRKFEGRDYEENLKGITQDLAILTGARVGSFGNFLSHFASWLNTLSMCMFPFFFFQGCCNYVV